VTPTLSWLGLALACAMFWLVGFYVIRGAIFSADRIINRWR
jgi:hypothetical protein